METDASRSKGHAASSGPDPQEAPRAKIPVRDKRKLREESPGTGAGQPAPSAGEEPKPTTEAAGEPADGARLEQAQATAAGYLDDLQRLQAEFDNYRKRTLKEQTRLLEHASVGIVAQLLQVLDHFQLAVAAAEETRDFDSMLKGVQMVYGELKEVLRAAGLESIDAKGRRFDPRLHEAALQVEGDGSGVEVVSEVLRDGYTFKQMVLRPAMVKVTQDASGADQVDA